MELFKNIFDAMEDKNPKDEFGQTPLHQAFCQSLYFSQTCNLQAELVCFDWADKM